jgi:hypothetical protein
MLGEEAGADAPRCATRRGRRAAAQPDDSSAARKCERGCRAGRKVEAARMSRYLRNVPLSLLVAIAVSVVAVVNAATSSPALAKTCIARHCRQALPPVNTSPPTITGIPEEGQTLQTSDGSWSYNPTSYSYAWQDCDANNVCSTIAGATSSSYTLGASDVGLSVRSVVTASNSAGSASAWSTATGPVAAAPQPPTNTAPPKISGTPQQGSTLSTDHGAWNGSPSSYAYQWQDCSSSGCANIPAANGPSYTLQASDVGDTIDVVVTASNSAGSASAVSARTATVTASSGSAGGAIPPMPVISHGLPAYGEGQVVYSPSNGDSADYGVQYRCVPTCALDIDLSSVPAAQRQQTVVTLISNGNPFCASCENNYNYNEPRDYTIDVNSAPGGSPPGTGWTTLVSVTGNIYSSREHFVNLGGANWIRARVTAVNGSSGNMDASFKLDVNDASQGTSDSWLFLGDSITGDMGNGDANNFMELVNAARPAYFPSEIAGGVGGWASDAPLNTDPNTAQAYIDEFLASFPGHFVSLDFGTNDANLGGGFVTNFPSNMTKLIDKVIAAGKVPVLRRSIPWGCTANIQANGPTINADLRQLLAQFPQAIAGPDDWSYFQANQSLIGDCIHPTDADGATAYRQQYVNALLSDGIYGGP